MAAVGRKRRGVREESGERRAAAALPGQESGRKERCGCWAWPHALGFWNLIVSREPLEELRRRLLELLAHLPGVGIRHRRAF
jgi:hypothetical protein